MEKNIGFIVSNNEKGVTLIELLAALSLLSIILLLASSVQLLGLKQSSSQSSEIQNQSNVRLAMNIITREIRKASTVTFINIDDTDSSNDLLKINGIDIYKLENKNITKNADPLITNIQTFTLKKIKDDMYTITIANTPSNNLPQTTLSSTIYIRNR
ncbi:prepilin-type N-terminal cleavage/methylation domain-containing protein [Neobacillus bataviensis]|uniref:Prepilin-type N-terminal cleavage/methylation domain-containing protein n=1 Tax=Neobacillus bataviensis TaxID=220685 RepID=A0A561DGQ3_9BACI|nr:prepilin-type N-terminal cleavage/methylation domain-containing protein [Neobacillus bataviensis]TWE02564.1 prepilin-type N-terminal cleavage/methylation domain-containing protein [Neobacillus bataviensis]